MFQGIKEAEYKPQLIPKGVRRFRGFDEKVMSPMPRGMTYSEIQEHIEELMSYTSIKKS